MSASRRCRRGCRSWRRSWARRWSSGRAGSIQLTAVGAEAVKRAEDVLARTEDLVEAARNAGQPLSGRFRLGVIPTVAPFLLPANLPGLRTAFPELRLFIREDLTPRLIAGLKAGPAGRGRDRPALRHRPASTTPVSATTRSWPPRPAGHALAGDRADPGGVAEGRGPDPAGGRPLPARPRPGRLRHRAARAARTSSPPPRLPTLVQMVGSGLGVSFLPEMAVRGGPGRHARRGRSGRSRPRRRAARSWWPGAPAPAAAAEARLLAEALTLD